MKRQQQSKQELAQGILNACLNCKQLQDRLLDIQIEYRKHEALGAPPEPKLLKKLQKQIIKLTALLEEYDALLKELNHT